MPLFLGEKEATNVGGLSLVKKEKLWTTQTKFSRTYLVVSDNLTQDEFTIITTTGIPPLYALVSGAFCMEKSGKEKMRVRHPSTGAAAVLWEVAAKFDSDIDVSEQDKQPEARTPVTRWTGENEDEQLEQDAIDPDKAIQTVPGEPIIVLAPAVRPILEVKRYELPPFDPNIMLGYANHTNSKAFYGAPIGCALMLPMDTNETTIEGAKYIEVIYRVKFKIKKVNGVVQANSWRSKPLHHGFKYFPELGTPAQAWNDANGNPATVNLAANGTLLAPGADPVFLSFNRFPKVDFDDLNLGPF